MYREEEGKKRVVLLMYVYSYRIELSVELLYYKYKSVVDGVEGSKLSCSSSSCSVPGTPYSSDVTRLRRLSGSVKE